MEFWAANKDDQGNIYFNGGETYDEVNLVDIDTLKNTEKEWTNNQPDSWIEAIQPKDVIICSDGHATLTESLDLKYHKG